jgi:glutamate formiminotransferase
MNKIIECVPNFSEGRDREKIESIADCFRGKLGVKLLDYSGDADHNRSVITVAGEPEAIKYAVIEAIGKAIELINLTKQSGEHPRMGAVDVVPFIPIKNVTMDEAIALSKDVAMEVGERFNLPVYLYEASATNQHRENLADVRRGEFEGLYDKMRLAEWKADFGPTYPHPTAGAVAIGARKPLIAYNINLSTNNVEIAKAIAKKVRHSSGGLRFCKAIGIELKGRGVAQVSMNLTDYTKTSIYSVHEMVRMEAIPYGVSIIGSEVIGLVPMAALAESAAYYLGIENFSINQVLEAKLWE